MTALETRKAVQHLLGVSDDGAFGPQTIAAYVRLKEAPAGSEWPPGAPVVTPAPILVPSGLEFDERTEKNLATLHPKAQPAFRALMRKIIPVAAAKGLVVKITSGTRTYAEQDALYRQATDGRDNDGDGRIDESDERVTKAPAGFSNHNFSVACDCTIFKADGKTPVYEHPLYAVFGPIGESVGLEWGGRWTFKDFPHYEFATGLTLAQMRARVAAGESVL